MQQRESQRDGGELSARDSLFSNLQEDKRKTDQSDEIDLRSLQQLALQDLNIFVGEINSFEEVDLKDIDQGRKKKTALDRTAAVFQFIELLFEQCPSLVEYLVRIQADMTFKRILRIVYAGGNLTFQMKRYDGELDGHEFQETSLQKIESYYIRKQYRRRITQISNLTEEQILTTLYSFLDMDKGSMLRNLFMRMKRSVSVDRLKS